MSLSSFGSFLVLVAALNAVPSSASAQCADWTGEFSPVPAFSTGSAVTSLAVFDDGSGPALYAGGGFTSAPGAAANRIARWDGATWTPLGSGVAGGAVRALAVFDDGSGPALYAGGGFTTAGGAPAAHIARWNGASWSAVGSGVNGMVHALCVFDSGAGPELVVGGDFTMAGGANASRVAKWNGTSWSRLSLGMSDGNVRALAVYDEGSGPRLFAGGNFASAGGATANHLARWDGTAWSELDGGVHGGTEIQKQVFPYVAALVVHDDGSGPALFAGGDFLVAGGLDARRIAKWTPAGFVSTPGLPLIAFEFQSRVEALAVADVGNGPELFAGGQFFAFSQLAPPGGRSLVRQTQDGWEPLAGGLLDPDQVVFALAAFEAQPGTGAELYAGGSFEEVGGIDPRALARWDGSAWDFAVNGASSLGLDGLVFDLASADLGDGQALYVAGSFSHAGT